jgi:hypothetical protein
MKSNEVRIEYQDASECYLAFIVAARNLVKSASPPAKPGEWQDLSCLVRVDADGGVSIRSLMLVGPPENRWPDTRS